MLIHILDHLLLLTLLPFRYICKETWVVNIECVLSLGPEIFKGTQAKICIGVRCQKITLVILIKKVQFLSVLDPFYL